MKTDKISFGQTYVKPSLIKYMAQENIEKLPYIFGFGELYPTDIYLGSNVKGGLTLDIMHSTTAKHVFFSDVIPKTLENITTLNFLHNMECAQRYRSGQKTPVFSTIIQNISDLSINDLQYTINEIIKHYYEKFGKKFFN